MCPSLLLPQFTLSVTCVTLPNMEDSRSPPLLYTWSAPEVGPLTVPPTASLSPPPTWSTPTLSHPSPAINSTYSGRRETAHLSFHDLPFLWVVLTSLDHVSLFSTLPLPCSVYPRTLPSRRNDSHQTLSPLE